MKNNMRTITAQDIDTVVTSDVKQIMKQDVSQKQMVLPKQKYITYSYGLPKTFKPKPVQKPNIISLPFEFGYKKKGSGGGYPRYGYSIDMDVFKFRKKDIPDIFAADLNKLFKDGGIRF